jgi:ribonuclease I
MVDSAISDELAAANRSLSAAIDALMQKDWGKLEQALIEVQGRTGRLLRELELQRGSLPKPPGSG